MNLHPLSRSKQTLVLILLLTCHWPSSFAKDKTTRPRCKGKLYASKSKNVRGMDYYMDIIHDLKSLTIPTRFDAREEWPNCQSIRTILNQGDCGGCWAFASSSAISDRLCIATNGTFNQLLSTQDLLECCIGCVPRGEEGKGGCEGGIIEDVFLFYLYYGIVTGEGSCKPLYEGIPKGIPQKKCREYCRQGYNRSYFDDKKFSVGFKKTSLESVRDLRHIQAEIMLHGPVTTSMTAYDYFSDIKSKTILYYNSKLVPKDEIGTGHAVKIIGWDVIDNTSVWIIANSWGTQWADKGFGYVRRGKNDFDIEEAEAMVTDRSIDGIKKMLTVTLSPSGSRVLSESSLTVVAAVLLILS